MYCRHKGTPIIFISGFNSMLRCFYPVTSAEVSFKATDLHGKKKNNSA